MSRQANFLSVVSVLFFLACSKEDNTYTPPFPPIPGNFVKVAAGTEESLGLTADGDLWGWGSHGLGYSQDSIRANICYTPCFLGSGYTAMAIGYEIGYQADLAGPFTHVLLIETDSTLTGWGYNNYGQLGVSTTYAVTASAVDIGVDFVRISAKSLYSLAIKSDGTLWAWGDNTYGQLGDGTVVNRRTPTYVASGYAEIAAGWRHALGIKTDGTLWAWGFN